MSLQVLNDEDVTSEESTENCDFLFSPPELSGRSSVLCLSQKENVPPRNLAKAMKVTFQTPLRDPQTHRILSPSMTSKPETAFVLDDTIGLENFQHIWPQKEKEWRSALSFLFHSAHFSTQKEQIEPCRQRNCVVLSIPVKIGVLGCGACL
uniref:Uncharacterized protein n=1 Tax=Prolemur simus TaxID=1328070 RepID=A0A8C8YKH0_PROSS